MIAYLLRPSSLLAAFLRGRRNREFGADGLPCGCFSAHVRHGNKGIEMPLKQWDDYSRVATHLLRVSDRLSRQINPYDCVPEKPAIFLSTEDDSVVRDALGDPRWSGRVFHAKKHRDNKPAHESGSVTYTEDALFSFFNLWLSIECDMVLGQRLSNWNRLISGIFFLCFLLKLC